VTPDMFVEHAVPEEEKRYRRLHDEMMKLLRATWGGPPRIAEPSDAEKVSFADAFVAASARRYP
jgi:hypothetical protein